MRLDHLLSKEFYCGSQLWAVFFHVVDVAECATAMKMFLPGGRTPWWLVHDQGDHAADCLRVGVDCVVLGG